MGRWKERFHEVKGKSNIADQTLGSFALPYKWSTEPWLTVPDPIKTSPVVIHRSPRYHNDSFPWCKVVEKYKGNIVMIGMRSEHETFCKQFGEVPYLHTKDYLELARVIAGAELFIGNQSSPYAVAEGLKKRTCQEMCLRIANCHWHRPGAVYGRDSNVILPELVLP